MILPDTSAWVEYDRATGSTVDERMVELIARDGDLAITDPIVMEVLVGASDDAGAASLRRFLTRFEHLPFDPAADFGAAVRIYRRCRERGITPRGLIDCMICAVAMRFDAEVLAADADFARFAEVVALRLDPASTI